MKKFLISVMLLTLSVALSSCKVTVDNEFVSTEQKQVPITTATTPITTVSKADKTAAILAKLTKEDGTGEINLKMSLDEITAVLDKYAIIYDAQDDQTVFIPDTGTIYVASVYNGYGRASFYQSYSGLKIGNTKNDVLKIYGEPDKITGNNKKIYTYHTAVSDDPWQTPIDFDVELIDDVVTHMNIVIDIPYDKIN